MLLLVDTANVLGSRPDGWWRDRAGATSRLLARIGVVDWAAVPTPVTEVVAIVEGQARDVPDVDGVRLVRAAGSGDDAIVATAAGATGLLLVTADRGLRARLPGVEAVGPGWLWAVLDRAVLDQVADPD